MACAVLAQGLHEFLHPGVVGLIEPRVSRQRKGHSPVRTGLPGQDRAVGHDGLDPVHGGVEPALGVDAEGGERALELSGHVQPCHIGGDGGDVSGLQRRSVDGDLGLPGCGHGEGVGSRVRYGVAPFGPVGVELCEPALPPGGQLHGLIDPFDTVTHQMGPAVKAHFQRRHVGVEHVVVGDIALVHTLAVERQLGPLRHSDGEGACVRVQGVQPFIGDVPVPSVIGQSGQQHVCTAAGDDVILGLVALRAGHGPEGKGPFGHGRVKDMPGHRLCVLEFRHRRGTQPHVFRPPAFPVHAVHGRLHHLFRPVRAQHAPGGQIHIGPPGAHDQGEHQQTQKDKSDLFHLSPPCPRRA